MGCGQTKSSQSSEPTEEKKRNSKTTESRNDEEQQQTQQQSRSAAPEPIQAPEENTQTREESTDDTSSPGKPFSDPPPEVMLMLPEGDDSDGSTGSDSEKRKKRAKRSKSIAVLQKISDQRHTDEESDQAHDEVDQPFAPNEDGPMSESTNDKARSPDPPRTRTRRLSSVYNEFSEHVERFLQEKDDKENSWDLNGSASSKDLSESQGTNDFLSRIFALLDQDNVGHITPELLKGGFSKMGYSDSNEKLTTMFECADKNKDGVIDREEFYSFFKQLQTSDLMSTEEATEDEFMKSRRRSRAPSAARSLLRGYKVEYLAGLKGRIKTIASSPFRPLLAACDREDKVVHLFDFKGNKVRVLEHHRDSMLGLSFSPDRKYMASASRDATVILWDCTVGHELGIIQHPGVVTAVSFSYDGKYIYTGCQDNLVRKYTVKRCQFIAVMDRLPKSQLGVIVAMGVQQHDDKEVVISRSCDTTATVLTSKLQVKSTLGGHKSMVWTAQYNSDGTMIVTSCESLVRVWNMSYDCIAEFNSTQFLDTPGVIKNNRPHLWTTAMFCPPQFGPLLVLFSSDTNIYFVAVDRQNLLLNINLKSAVYCASINDEMSAVICGDDCGNIYAVELS